MEELVSLYAMLANGGELRPLIFTTPPAIQQVLPVKMLSPEASYITGASLLVDGGYSS